MKEATCPAVTANLSNAGSVTAQLTINTTAPHHVAANRPASPGLYGFGVVAGVFLLAIPGMRRRGLGLGLLLLVCVGLIVGCGGGSSGGGHTDPGTPAGTYTVNVTASSLGITRTASFNVTVQ
jgi:hypothetical protein